MKVFFEQRPSASKPHPQTAMGMECTHTLGNMDGKWQEHGWEYGQRRAQDEPKTPPRRSKMRLRCPKTSPRRPQMVKKHENSHVPGEWGALTPQEHAWELIWDHFKILDAPRRAQDVPRWPEKTKTTMFLVSGVL